MYVKLDTEYDDDHATTFYQSLEEIVSTKHPSINIQWLLQTISPDITRQFERKLILADSQI